MRVLHLTSFDRGNTGQERVQWHHKPPAAREHGEVRRPP